MSSAAHSQFAWCMNGVIVNELFDGISAQVRSECRIVSLRTWASAAADVVLLIVPAGNAIGSRGKSFKSYTVKDRKKDLEEFQKTGVHPDIEAARKRAAADTLLALPDPDASRPRTYIEFAVDKAVIGVQTCALTLARHLSAVAAARPMAAHQFQWCLGETAPEQLLSTRERTPSWCPVRLCAGRVVFEVFQDVTPMPVRTFVNRCRAGTSATLQGSQVGSIVQLYMFS